MTGPEVNRVFGYHYHTKNWGPFTSTAMVADCACQNCDCPNERRTMSGTEVTRAGRADRDRYVAHLENLYVSEHIDKEELDGLRDTVLAVRDLRSLDKALDGLPKPPEPVQPPDMSIPENFTAHYLRRMSIGLLAALLPTVLLSGERGVLASGVKAVFLIAGLSIVVVAVVNVWMRGIIWDNLGTEERLERRVRDAERQ